VAWDGDWIKNANAFSFTQAYPDYNLPELASYAHSKGVKLIVHNETSANRELRAADGRPRSRCITRSGLDANQVPDTSPTPRRGNVASLAVHGACAH